MTTLAGPMSKGSVDKATKIAAAMLSGLMTTAPEDLEAFRSKRLGRGSKVELERIATVRGILLELAEALRSDDDDRWKQIDEAANLLAPAEAAPQTKLSRKAETETDTEAPAKPPRIGTPLALDDMPASIAAKIARPSPWANPTKVAAGKVVAPPFAATKGGTEPPPPSAPTAMLPIPEEPPPPSTTITNPSISTTQPTFSTPGPALPFKAPKRASSDGAPADLALVSAGKPPMTLSHYAALCASCGAFPLRIDETHTRFGLADRAARKTLDEAWRKRFDTDPREQQLYDALFTRFRAWLVQFGAV
jgi:hypothetical protein